MDPELRERRENIRQTIDNKALDLATTGVHPFEIQNIRSAAHKELARAIPDTEKYQQASNLATQYAQKGAV